MQPITRGNAVARAIPILLLTLLAIAVIAYIFFQTADAVNQNALLPAAACDGVPNRRLPLYETSPGTHPAVAFRAVDGRWVPDAQAIAPDWVPASIAATELVLCLPDSEPISLPACSGTGAVIYGYAQPLRLIAAASAALVAETTIASAAVPAADCLEAGAVEPRPVTALQIQAWLSRYAYIP